MGSHGRDRGLVRELGQMIVLLILFSVVFPLTAIIPVRRADGDVLCSRDYCSVIKGIATCFVMISHITILLGSTHNIGIFKIFDVLGGMGVLLFFFLSGYGLYIGYFGKANYKDYLIRRIENVVIPYLILKLLFWAVKCAIIRSPSLTVLLAGFDDWFIDVILIQYLIFWIAWRIFKDDSRKILAAVTVANICLTLIFAFMKLNPRWYNALLMFPIGMFFAAYNAGLKAVAASRKIITYVLPGILFVVFGCGFAVFKNAQFSGILKIIAGVFLAALIFRLSADIEPGSVIMNYIGRNSLYFYIIHLEVLKLLEGYYTVDPVIASYIIIIAAFAGVFVFSNGYNAVRSMIKGRNRVK